MDVATTLRRERERAQVELDREQTEAMLREKLLEVAAATGERVTPEEIHAAISQYYRSLHAFEPPERGFGTFLAHLYVRRKPIVITVTVLLAIFAFVWWFVEANFGSIARDRRDRELLERTFEIHVAHPSTADQSGFRMDYGEDSVNGWYVIVEARGANGDAVTQRIRGAISRSERDVSRWAEQVPREVYERLVNDKRHDGILDETLFAKKNSGSLELEIVMPGVGEQPLTRGRQLLEWEGR